MNAGDDLLVKLVGFLIKSVGFLWIQVYKLPKSNVQVCEFCGFPNGASGKDPAYRCRRWKRHRLNPWDGKIPWKRTWQPTPVFLLGESHGQRSLVVSSPQDHKESDTTKAT